MTVMVTHELERAIQIDGIINVKKEAGMTSPDVVFKLRKILGTKKIDHGGLWIRMWSGCFRLP